MKAIANIFLKGLVFTLPLAITFGLIYWLFASAENLLKIPLQSVLPNGWYMTGMGVVSAFAIIFCIGILVQAYVIKYLLQLLVTVVEKIPLVNTLYSSSRDLMQLFAGNKKNELNRVVNVQFNDDISLIGFVTNDDVQLGEKTGLYAVYFPLSYQIGGYLMYIKKERCQNLDISAQKAMQQILTAHVKRS